MKTGEERAASKLAGRSSQSWLGFSWDGARKQGRRLLGLTPLFIF